MILLVVTFFQAVYAYMPPGEMLCTETACGGHEAICTLELLVDVHPISAAILIISPDVTPDVVVLSTQ